MPSWHVERCSEPAFDARSLREELGEFGWGTSYVQWGIHIHGEIWRVNHLKREMLKHEIPYLWMVERFLPFCCTEHLMIGPPGPKFGAAKHQIMDQLGQPRITWVPTTRGTELG